MDQEVKCDFSKAKNGEKVFSLSFGEVNIVKQIECEKRVLIEYKNATYFRQWDGKVQSSCPVPDLYWSKPTIIAPPAPKRMKKVRIERWIVVVPFYGASDGFLACICHNNEPDKQPHEVHRFKIVEEFEVPDEQ